MRNYSYLRRNERNKNVLGSLIKYTAITGLGFILGIPIGAFCVAYVNQPPIEEIKHEVKVREKPSKMEHYVTQTGAISARPANTSTNTMDEIR